MATGSSADNYPEPEQDQLSFLDHLSDSPIPEVENLAGSSPFYWDEDGNEELRPLHEILPQPAPDPLDAAIWEGVDGQEEVAQRTSAWEKRHAQVLEAGGLHIFGTERHESRRIDNQLRGRAGRQGDPGVTRFYLSMEDNLMRLFASDGVRNFMQRLGMDEGEAIEHRMVSNAIEKAQRKVEGRNFDIRKQLLEFDDVSNDQRQIVYQQRNDILLADEILGMVDVIRKDVVNEFIDGFIPPQSIEEQWDIAGLEASLAEDYDLPLPIAQWLEDDDELHEQTLRIKIVDALTIKYKEKVAPIGLSARRFEKQIMLQILAVVSCCFRIEPWSS